MDFRYGGDTTDLQEGARSWLEGVNTPERLRAIADGSDPLSLWDGLVEMGLLGASAPGEAGGLGLAPAETVLLAEEAGRTGLPEPYSDTAFVLIPALVEIGEPVTNLLASAVSGEMRGALVHPLNPFVNHGQGLDFALVCQDDNIMLAQGDELRVTARENIDPGRKLSQLSYKGGTFVSKNTEAEQIKERAAARGALAAAAELCGLADRMITLATEYSQTREQFGKPIGSFQAVKHLLADAKVKVEFARPVVYRAGAALNETPDVCDLAVSHAKVAAGDAALLAAENAIQVFGGMGYTFEVDLHFYMKRAWALIGQWGDRSYHVRRIDEAVLSPGARIGPGTSFS